MRSEAVRSVFDNDNSDATWEEYDDEYEDETKCEDGVPPGGYVEGDTSNLAATYS